MWLACAAIGTFFYAVVHILDSHCVGNIFEKPWFGVITGALSTLILYLIFFPFWIQLSWDANIYIIGCGLLAGALIQLSYYFYFTCLAHSEAGVVAAYWNLVPAILPIASFVLLGHKFDFFSYIGIAILILFSTIMCLADSNIHTRWTAFFLMLVASIGQVFAYLLEAYVFAQIDFLAGFFWVTTGLILSGLAPLMIPKIRRPFARNLLRIRKSTKIILFIEMANLLALFSIQKSVSLIDPSFVSAIATTLPAFIFIISMILLFVYPKYGDERAKHKIGIKFAAVAGMVIGVILVS